MPPAVLIARIKRAAPRAPGDHAANDHGMLKAVLKPLVCINNSNTTGNLSLKPFQILIAMVTFSNPSLCEESPSSWHNYL